MDLDPKHRRWVSIAERVVVILALFGGGGILGYMTGVQGSDARLTAADQRLVQERADRIDEIKRLQDSHNMTVSVLTRQIERAARKVERAADKADNAADKAENAATTAKGAANRATRAAPVPAATLNRSVREANKQLRGDK